MLKVRRLLALILVLCLFLSISCAETYIVDPATGVNLRDANGGGNVIKVVRHGSQVEVIGEDKFWYEVELADGLKGYIYKDYLHPASGEELREKLVTKKITHEADAKFIGTLKETVKVYKKANGKLLGTIEEGDFVFILQTGQYWNKIVWNNTEVAYIQSSACEISEVNIPGEGVVYRLQDDYTRYKQVPIRKEPNSNSRRIMYAKNDSYVRVVEEVNDKWALVSYDGYGHMGYVSKLYLRKVKKYN